MLKTQTFLKSGGTLEDLKTQYGISARIDETEGLVCLNYSMIESPMGEPIVHECRQLILSLTDWSVVSFGLLKFFNWGEGHVPQSFDWEDFQTFEKLDGSLIAFYFWKGRWHCATRSVPGGSSNVDDTGLTFKDLVLMALKDMGTSWEEVTAHFTPGHTYVCELTCEENQVVCHYGDRKLTLLAIRSLQEPDYPELSIADWGIANPNFPLPQVKLYEKFSLEAVQELVQSRNPLEYEGFVLVDKNWNRVKLKGSAYVLMSHQRDGLGKSNKARLSLLLAGKFDDVSGILPGHVVRKIEDLQRSLISLACKLTSDYLLVKDIQNQKEFALTVATTQGVVPSAMFAMRKWGWDSGMAYLSQCSPAHVLDLLRLGDEG